MSGLKNSINTLVRDLELNLHQAIKIFNTFFLEFSGTKKLLEYSLEKKDFESISRQCHKLQGTSANLRIPDVSILADQIGKASKIKDASLCKLYIFKLEKHILQLESEFNEYRQNQSLRILIVEDNPINSRLLEQIIENLGHQSLGICVSAEQALVSVKEKSPDLIFMDINLSSAMNGIYTAELLASLYSVAIVFVSVHSKAEYINEAKRIGVGFIVKPFMPKEIEEMIDQVYINIKNKDKIVHNDVTLKVKNDNKISFININNIICFEASGHTIFVYTEFNSFKLSNTLKEIAKLDSNNCFIMPHRSFLINKHFIQEIIHQNNTYQIKLKGLPQLIPISKNNIKKIKNLSFK